MKREYIFGAAILVGMYLFYRWYQKKMAARASTQTAPIEYNF